MPIVLRITLTLLLVLTCAPARALDLSGLFADVARVDAVVDAIQVAPARFAIEPFAARRPATLATPLEPVYAPALDEPFGEPSDALDEVDPYRPSASLTAPAAAARPPLS
ncbi:hypothetical protein [Chitinimonas koreensis]|uniref:hypothetical protein n=1 Tax=Chitinimonas koreensis TaxID=356302 RepID=UPI000555C36A|nr:hypothetical protein [Chitinimonas koreensis]QNM97984.1 hypothetical protein H9L41_06925 [Chitinimonas koreensis]